MLFQSKRDKKLIEKAKKEFRGCFFDGKIYCLEIVRNKKHKRRVLFLCVNYTEIAFQLYDKGYREYPTIKAVLTNQDSIMIECISSEDEKNCGNGTILMNSLIKYAKNNQIHTIAGFLIKTDTEEEKKGLIHFYKKFGFEIDNNNILLKI